MNFAAVRPPIETSARARFPQPGNPKHLSQPGSGPRRQRLPGGAVSTRFGARGVTFVELLIAISIISLLLAASVPSFRDASRSQTVAARIAVLHEDMSFARAEAVKLQENVLLVASSNDWADGWRVFVDSDGQQDYDAGEPTLREQGTMPDGYSMEVADGPGLAQTQVGFSRRGAVAGGNIVNVVACAPGWTSANDKVYARNARVAASGRAESSRGVGGGTGISCG